MNAAVYHGRDDVRVEDLPIPSVGPGEVLIRVHACGVCPTDLKKIHDGKLEPPRVFGHETAGVIAEVGEGVSWQVGDRVVVHHHIPCLKCFYCERKFYAQCPQFKETGTTAGFEPSGGGFAEFVLARDWIVERGLVRIPDDVSFEEATFVEPVNCCLKAVQYARVREGDVALVFGQGAMGLALDQLLTLDDIRVVAIDPIAERLARARVFGAEALMPNDDVACFARQLTEGRGADVAMLATDHPSALEQAIEATRPGARIVLFAHTQVGTRAEVEVGNLCVLDKRLFGAYSASYDLQVRAAEVVFTGRVKVADLITHRFPLDEIGHAIAVASNPSASSLKVVVTP